MLTFETRAPAPQARAPARPGPGPAAAALGVPPAFGFFAKSRHGHGVTVLKVRRSPTLWRVSRPAQSGWVPPPFEGLVTVSPARKGLWVPPPLKGRWRGPKSVGPPPFYPTTMSRPCKKTERRSLQYTCKPFLTSQALLARLLVSPQARTPRTVARGTRRDSTLRVPNARDHSQ